MVAWPAMAALAALAVNALILLAVSLEIHSYWWRLRWQGGDNLYETIECTRSSPTRRGSCSSARFCWARGSGGARRFCAGRRWCCWRYPSEKSSWWI